MHSVRQFLKLSAILLRLTVSAKGFTVDTTDSFAPLSLYTNSEQVTDLTDSSISSTVYNSQSLWLVQFYAHWCGHCQRFAPVWKSLAKDIEGWSPLVKMAAINCAEQSCDRYQIRGTPTVRVFHPETIPNTLDSSYYGFEIPVTNDPEYFKSTIIYNLHQAVEKGQDIGVTLTPLRQSPLPIPDNLVAMFDSLSPTIEYVGLIFENQFSGNTGTQVILDLSHHSDTLQVFKVDSSDLQAAREWRLSGSSHTLVVISRAGKEVDRLDGWGVASQDRRRFTNLLTSYVQGSKGVTKVPEIKLEATSSNLYTIPDKVVESVPDQVYLGDLERALEYSLMQEVAMQPVLDSKKLQALVYFLETILQFFPGQLREPIRGFLVGLREWPVQMRYSSVSHTQYKEKVAELSAFYNPWKATPDKWVGCAGSKAQYRGYPCSLWTTFHALTVSAANKDPAFLYSGGSGVSTVANAMIGYIRNFFSCRDCAQHFAGHVASLGFLPRTGDQSIMWLWTIHNKANKALAGDLTEDPTYPKIQWPSNANCPNCKTSSSRWSPLTLINGEYWNQAEVVSYIKQVYGEQSLKNNTLVVEEEEAIYVKDLVASVLGKLRNTTATDDNWEKYYKEAHQSFLEFCNK